MSRRKNVAIAFLTLLVGVAQVARANPTTITVTAEVSGSLGSVSFGSQYNFYLNCFCELMTVTLTGQTSNVMTSGGPPFGGPDFTLPGMAGSINITSPGSGTIVSGNITGSVTAFADNNVLPGVTEAGLIPAGSINSFWDMELFPPVQTPYNLAMQFSSGNNFFAPGSVSAIPTDNGYFEIDSIEPFSGISWTQTVATTPEPRFTRAFLASALLSLALLKRVRQSRSPGA